MLTVEGVNALCKAARIQALSVEIVGTRALVRIAPLKVDPKTAALNLYKAGGVAVVWSWNGGNEQLWISERAA